ncbi:MAG: TonB-dependent receptor [Acidobacteriota bacterium]
MSSALRAFSDQSNLQVLYATELVADFESPGVAGSHTPEEAITVLLSSSPLGFVFNGDDTIAVTENRDRDSEGEESGSDATPSADPSTSVDEAIVVTGTRYTIQSSIQEKRSSDLVVEALTTEEIGDIPALSIGEALETLTGVASHREQGGATEVSIRGLGPFLGATTINRREATNGSGDRSVNFSQFPSELFNTIKVYKTQQASLIEGGVSGQIELETARPLDRTDRSLLFELKGAYNPDNDNINIAERDLGSRSTFSYIDQFKSKGGDRFGIALGFQRNVTTNPESEARSSSTYRDCRNDPSVSAGVFSSGNCDSGRGDLVLEVDPATGVAPDANAPFIFVPSQRSYRQNITDDERDAFFAAFQWQPNDRLDFYLDTQYSDRTFTEIRNDLVFAEQRRIDPEGLIASPDGSVQFFQNNGRIETNSTFQERLEEYTAIGLGLTYDPNDRLQLSFDAAYSDTSRRENIVQTRLQSEPRDIFGNPTPAGTDRPDARYTLSGGGSDVFTVVLTDFDVTNADLFADNARTRIDLNQARDNTIRSIRGDFELQTDWGAIYRLDGGVRASELEFQSFPRVRDQRTFSDSAIEAVSLACRNAIFPESDFLSGPSNGQNLVTNVDENGNVLADGTGSSFASFDPLCLANRFIGEPWAFPDPEPSTANIDVEETTYAAYLQANYVSEIFGKQVRGNFGLRIVNTDVDSTGLRTTFTTSTNPDGTLEVNEDRENFFSVVGGGSYTELLPSFSATIDVTPETIFRLGIFRGLSRPDPADLGFGRSLAVNDGDDPTSINDLEGTASGASGNPDLEPLTSWNLDLALEWYPNKDTILAVGTYYKRFLGGFENTQRVEEFAIDGQPFLVDVTTSRTDTDSSEIFGIEFTGSHSFSYLASPFWSGFGVKASYNYASSDFEFEDQNFGASLVLDEAGNVVSERVGIVAPAEIFGLSEHVFSAQVYYETSRFDLAAIYKYRSEYFQQFISTPGLIRFVDDTEVVEVKASYKLRKQLTLKVEGINLFDEPRKQFIPVSGNLSELNSYGPRYFVGLRYRL